MNKMGLVLWALVAGLCSLRGSAAAEPIDVTLCKLVGNPAAFTGKMVRIRAEVRSFWEGTTVVAECDRKAVGVPLYSPDLVRDSDRPDFTLLKDENLKKFDDALSKVGWGIEVVPSTGRQNGRESSTTLQESGAHPSERQEGRVFATLVGRFDGPDKLTVTDKSGKTVVRKGYGFTPSALYQTRLILKSVSDVAITK